MLLLQHQGFSEWVASILHNKKGAAHLLRMPVFAALAQTWLKHPAKAEEFWLMLRDDCDEPAKSPIRKLYKYLLTHKLGPAREGLESANNRAMYLHCLLTWNAWKGKTDLLAYKEDMPTPVVV